jgi:hypothetical protein
MYGKNLLCYNGVVTRGIFCFPVPATRKRLIIPPALKMSSSTCSETRKRTYCQLACSSRWVCCGALPEHVQGHVPLGEYVAVHCQNMFRGMFLSVSMLWCIARTRTQSYAIYKSAKWNPSWHLSEFLATVSNVTELSENEKATKL